MFFSGFVTSSFVCQRISKVAQNKANRGDIIRHQTSFLSPRVLCYAIRSMYALFLYHRLYARALYPYTMPSIIIRSIIVRSIPIYSILVHPIPRALSPARSIPRVNKSYISIARPILVDFFTSTQTTSDFLKSPVISFFSIQSTSINAVVSIYHT